jgi:mono/diheme cytochrome c family protein
MAVLTWKGATAQEALASEVVGNIPRWIADEHLPKNAIPGVNLFARAGCTACHTYDGAGGSNLGAPDLTDIASRHLGIATQIKHLMNPGSVTPGSPMPSFASLGQSRLMQLAIFLEASKGTH